MKSLGFIKQFLEHPTQTGAVKASSPWLARQILATANISPQSSIVEFGPGTGVFTEEIVQGITSDNYFFAIEVNERFVQATRHRCPNVRVVHDSAENTRRYLHDQGLKSCDRIISGLPWAAFPPALQDTLLDTVLDVLSPGGRFVTFAYLQGLLLPAGKRFHQKLKNRFRCVGRSPVVWWNLPPAIVYWAEP